MTTAIVAAELNAEASPVRGQSFKDFRQKIGTIRLLSVRPPFEENKTKEKLKELRLKRVTFAMNVTI